MGSWVILGGGGSEGIEELIAGLVWCHDHNPAKLLHYGFMDIGQAVKVHATRPNFSGFPTTSRFLIIHYPKHISKLPHAPLSHYSPI